MTWDKGSKKEVVAAAREVLVAFARPDISQGQWWSDLAPMLTSGAREDYRYVAVENVPVTKVTSKGEVVEDEAGSAYLARVEFETDAGTYSLLMSRQGQQSQWLAVRIDPERG